MVRHMLSGAQTLWELEMIMNLELPTGAYGIWMRLYVSQILGHVSRTWNPGEIA